MLRVGITGGMGSGKSTVARIFQVLGVPVYYADDEAKMLMRSDGQLKAKIIQIFGYQAYVNDTLNRSFISAEAFRHPEKLEQLNAVVHPAVISHAEAWMHRHADAPYTLKEAALLFESGSWKQLDLVIGVYCPKPLRLARVMKRDGVSEKDVLARMDKQMDEDEKMRRCQFVIQNDEKRAILPQVLDLHRELLGRT